MDKRFLGILGAIIVVFIVIFTISQNSSNSGSGNSSGHQATNHVEGNNAKGVTLVEYGDYECPICGAYYQPLKTVAAKYSNDIHFQFRNLPLTSIHRNAFAAARAAEAASLQNKFWQMHDQLYQNQDPNGASGWVASSDPLNDYFVNFAKQIGLNISQFKTDYASGKVNDSISADLAAFGKTHQQQATPTFFLNGTYLPNTGLVDSQGIPSADKIGAVLQAEIDKKPKQ
jgi:protein-disulfide isomerase